VIQKKGQVMCQCGNLICFGCGKEGHWPCSCEQQKWWLEIYSKEKNLFQENESEALNLKWLMRYTQECPKCNAPIEKNGGCNHMNCKKCSWQYCWICKEKWAGSHYSCTNIQESSNSQAEQILQRIDNNLSFRQLYMITLRGKKQDQESKEIVFRLIKQSPAIQESDIDLFMHSLELLYFSRHLILKICIFGKYLQEHKLQGTISLKKEIRFIISQISFTKTCIEVTASKYNREDVQFAIAGIQNSIQSFVTAFGSIVKSSKLIKTTKNAKK